MPDMTPREKFHSPIEMKTLLSPPLHKWMYNDEINSVNYILNYPHFPERPGKQPENI